MHISTAAPAERMLRGLGMPPEDICAVLVADDPRLVRRHLELHRERLAEELVDRRRTLAALERELTDAALERSRARRPTGGLVQPPEGCGNSIDPSSATVQNGLWATSHG